MKQAAKATRSSEKIGALAQLFRSSSSSNGRPSRSRMIMIPVTILLGLGLIYFYFYSNAEGEKFDKRRFRVLQLLEQNISNKKSGYRESLQQITELIPAQTLSKKTADILLDQINSQKEVQILDHILLAFEESKTDKTGYYFLDYLEKPVIKDVNGNDSNRIAVYIRLSDYIKELIPTKTFDNVLILEASNKNLEVKYQNLPNKIIPKTSTSVASNTSLNLFLKDSIGLLTGIVREVEVDGEMYRLYPHVTVGDTRGTHEIICGLVKSRTYVANKRQVNIWFVVVLSIVMIVTVVSLPVLKIYIINDIERMKASDVVLSGMSIIIGAPLILLIILSVTEYTAYYQSEQPDSLKGFASQLDSAMHNEVGVILSQLETSEKMEKLIMDLSQGSGVKTKPLSSDQLSKFLQYNHFNELYGICEDGGQKFSLTTYKEEKNLIDLSQRQYYRDLKDENLLLFNTVSSNDGCFGKVKSKQIPYVMQSLSSWTTGDHEVVVAIPTDAFKENETSYLAISTKASSVMEPILKPGFGYAIIDKEGNTWFHSNPSRMNSENFLNELGDNSTIRTAMFGNQALTTQTSYWGERIRLHIKPSNHFPLYVATFYEMQHARSFIAEISSLSILFVVVGFLLVGALVYATHFAELRRRLFRFRKFPFDWLRPSDDQIFTYSVSIFHMIFVGLAFIGVLVYTSISSETLWYAGANIVASALILPPLLYVSNYWICSLSTYKLFENAGLVGLVHAVFLSLYLIVLYQFVEKPFFLWMVGVWFFSLLILILAISTKRYLDQFNWRFGFSSTVSGVFGWLNAATGIIENRLSRKIPPEWKALSQRYLSYLKVWLFVSSIMPVTIIFGLTKNMEEILYYKYEQLKIAKSIDGKYKEVTAEFNTTDNGEFELKKTYGYQFGGKNQLYVDGMTVSLDSFVEAEFTPTNKFEKWITILEEIRPSYSESLVENRATLKDFNDNSTWYWEISSPDKKQLSVDLAYRLENKISGKEAVLISSELDGHDSISFIGGLSLESLASVGWIIFLSAIILLFICLSSVLKYLCSHIFSTPFGSYSFDSDDLDVLKRKARAGEVLLICNSNRVKKMLKKELSFCTDFDKLISDLLIPENKASRLNLIEKAFRFDRPALIATKYPSKLLESLSSLEEFHVREEIEHHIAHYKQVIVSESLLQSAPSRRGIESVIEEDIESFKDQQKNYQYYSDIWRSATTREKYILYDLAEDGFANTKNSNSTLYLINKGLIKWNGQLDLMNNGFRNFILTAIRKKEGREIENEMAARGSWSVIKFILFGLIASILVFIALGEPDYFTDFNTMITLIASIVTLFPVIGSLFSVAPE